MTRHLACTHLAIEKAKESPRRWDYLASNQHFSIWSTTKMATEPQSRHDVIRFEAEHGRTNRSCNGSFDVSKREYSGQ